MFLEQAKRGEINIMDVSIYNEFQPIEGETFVENVLQSSTLNLTFVKGKEGDS